MLGVTVMIGLEALDGSSLHVIGELAVVGAALSYGFASLYGRRFRGQSPLVTASGQVTATALMMLPVAAVADQPWSLATPGPVTWGALAGLALLSTAVAYIIYFRILAVAGATNLVLVTFLIPVSALLLGTTILDESLAPRHLIGMALIALGLASMDVRLFRWGQRRGRLSVAPVERANVQDVGP